jgi:hypothetical protein
MVRPVINQPFCCPRCNYETKIGRDMNLHFQRKTGCTNINNIELTDEIKEIVLKDRIYHKPVIPPTIILKQEVENNSSKIKYKCPRCDYTTNKVNNMQTHFKRKKGCENKNNLELTDIIKEIVLQDRIYHVPKNKKDCVAIKQLTLKNEMLEHKLSESNVETQMGSNGENLIYLIQEREFVNTNVFKFGRTNKLITERLKGYSNGSIVIHTHKCNRCNKDMEMELKLLYNDNVILRKDIGTEYIEGNYNDICKIFMKCCLQDIE